MSLTTALEHEADLTLNNAQTLENANLPTMPIICRRAKEHSAATVSLHYLAEGAANVVFNIRASTDGETPFDFLTTNRNPEVFPRAQLLGHVLRVSKGLDKTLSGTQIKSDFDSEVAPLFYEDNLVKHLLPLQLARLDSEIIAYLNEQIKSKSRRKVQIKEHDDTTYGLLMQDMSPVPGESISIEIKPKWLAQSPNAPKTSYRCRNCALQALKVKTGDTDGKGKKKRKRRDKQIGPSRPAALAPHSSTATDESYICPLQLHSGDESLIQPFIHHKVLEESNRFSEPLNPRTETQLVDAVTEYFAKGDGHRLLSHLKHLQIKHDPHGILARDDLSEEAEDAEDRLEELKEEAPSSKSRKDAHEEEVKAAKEHIDRLKSYDRGLRLAMTLRDCSLYVKASYTGGNIEIESKLGDLDFKSDEKISDWKVKEQQLIKGLFYRGAGTSHGERNYKEDCAIAEAWRRQVPHFW